MLQQKIRLADSKDDMLEISRKGVSHWVKLKERATTVTYVSGIGATMDGVEPKEPKKRAQTKQATAFS
eukprot:1142138-Pelagomonas_calceolata.AAC.1